MLSFDEEELLTACIRAVAATPEQGEATIFLPTQEEKTTKKNRVRFLQSDSTSPTGVVMRGDPVADLVVELYPQEEVRHSAPARFSCAEIVHWIMKKRGAKDSG